MTDFHKKNILSQYPESTDKLFMLMSFIGSDEDIDDPIGGDLMVYQSCFNKMKPALYALLEHIKEY